jgi:hypothetical protein
LSHGSLGRTKSWSAWQSTLRDNLGEIDGQFKAWQIEFDAPAP